MAVRSRQCGACRATSRVLVVLAAVLLAGCCAESTRLACEQERVARQQATAAAPAVVSTTPGAPMQFAVSAGEGVQLTASLAASACAAGKGAAAEVRLDWNAAATPARAVRILVVEAGLADKLWIEAGAAGSATTGGWINDGMRLRLEAMPGGELLGEVRAVSERCP